MFLLPPFQAPPGIKKNMQRTYENWTPEFVAQSNSVARAQSLFALCWFHALVQERRNYIPQVILFFFLFSTEVKLQIFVFMCYN